MNDEATLVQTKEPHDRGSDAGAPVPFELLGRTGRTARWRLFAAPVAMAALGAVCLGLAIGAMLLFAPLHELKYALHLFGRVKDWSAVETRESILTFCILLGSIAAFLPAVLIAARLMHGRPMRTFVTGRSRFDFRAAALSFAVFGVLDGTGNLVVYAVAPDGFSYVLDPARFLTFLPFVAVLVTMQILAEEVFFRGWLLQAVGRFTARKTVLVGLPAAVFALAHFQNPEVGPGGAWVLSFYFLMAAYLTWIAIRGNGLEYAVGMHLANNLMVFSIVGNSASPYPSPTVFFARDVDFTLGLALFAATLCVHYWICFGRARRVHG